MYKCILGFVFAGILVVMLLLCSLEPTAQAKVLPTPNWETEEEAYSRESEAVKLSNGRDLPPPPWETKKEGSAFDPYFVSDSSGKVHPNYSLIIFSIVITWAIGLLPPLIIRYIILKRPIARWPAIGMCALFLIVNLVLFSAISANPKKKSGGGSSLIAIASYWILRSGVSKLKEQNRKTSSEGEFNKKQQEQKTPPKDETFEEKETNDNRQQDYSHSEKGTYYRKIFNINEHATFDEIKTIYRELVKQYHPDKVRSLGPKIRAVAEKEIRLINEAYEYFRHKYEQ